MGALQSLICMILLKYVPVIVMNAVLDMSEGYVLTCLDASVSSIFDLTIAYATSL